MRLSMPASKRRILGAADLKEAHLSWSLVVPDGQVVARGRRDFASVPTWKVSRLDEIAVPLGNLHGPTALRFEARLGEGRMLERVG